MDQAIVWLQWLVSTMKAFFGTAKRPKAPINDKRRIRERTWMRSVIHIGCIKVVVKRHRRFDQN